MWIIFVAVAKNALAWTAFVLLAVVAVLGFTMLARWVPTYRTLRRSQAATASGAAGAVPAERHFPVAVVVAHGVLGAATLLLVLLIAL